MRLPGLADSVTRSRSRAWSVAGARRPSGCSAPCLRLRPGPVPTAQASPGISTASRASILFSGWTARAASSDAAVSESSGSESAVGLNHGRRISHSARSVKCWRNRKVEHISEPAWIIAKHSRREWMVSVDYGLQGLSSLNRIKEVADSFLQNGHVETVKCLISIGADPNPPDSPHTAIRAAALFGHHDIIRLLLSHKVSLSTTFICASGHHYQEC